MATLISNSALQRIPTPAMPADVSPKAKNVATSRPDPAALQQSLETQLLAPISMTDSIETVSRKSNDINLESNSLKFSLGTMQGMEEMVNRASDLAKLAGSNNLSDEERGQLQEEAGVLMSQVRDTVKNTEFMGVKLFEQDGAVPVGSDGSITIKSQDLLTGFTGSGAFDIDLSSADKALQSQQSLQSSKEMVAKAIKESETSYKKLAEEQVRYGIQTENLTAAKATFEDTDIAMALADAIKISPPAQMASAMMQKNVSMFQNLASMIQSSLR